MARLVVEVHNASDLMPKDGQGSASPYVEVDFDNQQQRTQTKHKDLNPSWNENLVFNINDLREFPHRTIDVSVYNDRKGGRLKHFLGRVRISGVSVPLSESESSLQRYPLDKRGLFSNIRGDIALKIYADPSGSGYAPPPPQQPTPGGGGGGVENIETLLQEINTNHVGDGGMKVEEKVMKKKKEKEVRTFHSIGGGTATGGHAPYPPAPMFAGFGYDNQGMKEKQPTPEARSDLMRAGPANALRMQQFPGPPMANPAFALVETSPSVSARRRHGRGDKTSTTYDLVEPMHFLYVSVVKARDLPVMDLTGSLDPYVEVKLGNYKGITKPVEKNPNPVWGQVFAFSKERLQSNNLEVTVMDKDLVKDDFVGRVFFDLTEVPVRVPPDSPLAPQWYKLEEKSGAKVRGEIMLAVWDGTQADESFSDAWHSDAHNISHANLTNTRSKVYFSPKLYYLRVHVIEAQDLIPVDRGRAAEVQVKVSLGSQVRLTKPFQIRVSNPVWNDEFMFVASEPFDDHIIVRVEDRVGGNNVDILGMLAIPLRDVPQRLEHAKGPDPRWHNLQKPSMAGEEESERKKGKFSSKIHLRLWVDAGYHVLDETTHFSSDLQPSSKHLRKTGIGILELGILSAQNLLPMKGKEGKTTDAYCVAKYGNKWVRTRTLLDTLHPRWNEQYTWEVHDLCTVITVGVFDNSHVNGHTENHRDQRIGKVRIRLSTLETDRIYTHNYPLLVLQHSGLKKHGELQLALRFTCTAWVNMMAQYGRPLLPKMHYVQPIPVRFIDLLRHQAMQIVAARLDRAEPPLRREIVEYMLDVDIHMWSLRRSKANFSRIMSLLSGVTAICRWLNDICTWRNPITTCLVLVLFLILVCYPELILPTIFLYLFVIGLWNYRFRSRHPPHMDARVSNAEFTNPDELDEEFDTFPTSKGPDVVRQRYDRLRIVAGKVQGVVGDLASQGERAQALLSWRDPRATAIFIIFALIWAVFIYVTPFQVIAVLSGLYLLRHPRFRSKLPSVPFNFFRRLPSKSDMLLLH